MFSVTFTVPDRDRLALLISKGLSVEGATCGMVVQGPGGTTHTAIHVRAKPNGPKAEKGQGRVVLLQIIQQTFGGGDPWEPKQIKAVVNQRGIKDGTFYTSLKELTKQGKLKKAGLGKYRLVLDKQTKE